jgi:DNA gyrase subunit B
VTINDAEAADKVFELLMGSDVGPRKEFIVEAEGLAQDRIDA